MWHLQEGLTSPLAVSLLPALPLILVRVNLLLHLEKEPDSRGCRLWQLQMSLFLTDQSAGYGIPGLFLHH